jgi:endonuclease YncB( thermonuclease family)
LEKKVIWLVLGTGAAIAAVFFSAFYLFNPAAEPGVPPPHYEVIATVTSMIDGDTTWVRIENIVVELDPEGEVYEGRLERVRYGGGIDAPETWTTPPREGSYEAKEFIEYLIPVGTTVYLDLNDLSVGGQTGRPYRGLHERLIAVVYAEIGGQWVNINAELLRWGREEFPDHNWLKYIDYPSEWDPYEWLEDDYPYLLG